MAKKQQRFICVICAGDIDVQANGWAGGHNAYPVVREGRCCTDCNTTVVVPARILELHNRFQEGKKEKPAVTRLPDTLFLRPGDKFEVK